MTAVTRGSEGPILFSGPMVRAILDGRKTQTRRVLKPQPTICPEIEDGDLVVYRGDTPVDRRPLRYRPGMLLWVRESFVIESNQVYRDLWKPPSDGRPIRTVEDPEDGEWEQIPHYRATDGEPHIVTYDQDDDDDRTRWRPSIHMPRWASRLTLEVTAVKVERLQDISEEDAKAEGIDIAKERPDFRGVERERFCACVGDPFVWRFNAVTAFRDLWTSINGPGSWEANPWIVAVSFTAHRQNIDQFKAAQSAPLNMKGE